MNSSELRGQYRKTVEIDRGRACLNLLLRFNVPSARVIGVLDSLPRRGKYEDGIDAIGAADIEAVGRYRLVNESGHRRAYCTDTGDRLWLAGERVHNGAQE